MNIKLQCIVSCNTAFDLALFAEYNGVFECKICYCYLKLRIFNIYANSHWKYHTFEGYYICSFSKLRHKVHKKECQCSPTYPLQNGIVTFYENFTINILQSMI